MVFDLLLIMSLGLGFFCLFRTTDGEVFRDLFRESPKQDSYHKWIQI